MSSTMSTTEIQTIAKTIVLGQRKMEEKRLVRTSSLEKIRRFNSFICAQQYYILPSLLAWLRSSQSVLQNAAEKTIFFFRYLLFSHLLYKFYQVDFRLLLSNVLVLSQKICLTKYNELTEHLNLFKMLVYLTASILVIELGVCIYLLCGTCVPSGLVFLIVCLFYIIYLNIRCNNTLVFTKIVMKKKRN